MFRYALLAWLTLMPVSAFSQQTPLLLFDGETGRKFAGCLNCGKFEDVSVCNQFGDFGSKFSSTSIWNQFGDFGSKFATNSPWNQFGEGLRIVDPDGNYYGRFTSSVANRSNLPLVSSIVDFYKRTGSLPSLRDALCE